MLNRPRKLEALRVTKGAGVTRPNLYVAAPFFSEGEVAYNLEIKRVLAPYFDVFLPQESGCLMGQMIQGGTDVRTACDRVFQTDIEAILACEVLLIVLNGRAIDEGAAFELGFAKAIDKLCFGLQTDSRCAHSWGNNPMIVAAVEAIYGSLQELEEWARSYATRNYAVGESSTLPHP